MGVIAVAPKFHYYKTVYTHVKRNEIWWIQLDYGIGSEQSGYRPALIIQNNIGNMYSPTTIIAPISSKIDGKHLPTHVILNPKESGLPYTSVVMLEQIRVIDKKRLRKKVGALNSEIMKKDNAAMLI